MILTLPLPDKALSPNARFHAIRKSTITRHARQLAFFATLKALGVPAVPTRILMGDRPKLGITHKKPLASADYRKISALLFPADPPAFATYFLAFHFPQERNRDDDNAAASCKAYRDGIADALRIDDSTLRMAGDPALLIDRQRPRLEITLNSQGDGSPSQNSNEAPPTCSLLRAWKIEPAGNHGIDTLYILHGERMRWDDVMQHAEYSLEQQMEVDGSGNLERPWDEMKVTITGVLLTPEEWEEISGNEF